MTREEQLKYCKICLNRKTNLESGIYCGLTGEIANFEETCPEFKEDLIKVQNETISQQNEIFNDNDTLKNQGQWFLWICCLSILNSVIMFTGGDVNFIFGLGITQLFEGIYFGLIGEFNLIGLILSSLISGIFYLIWIFSKKLNRIVFIIGMILYALDSMLFLLVSDWLSFGFHIFALFGLFKGFTAMNNLLEKQETQEKALDR